MAFGVCSWGVISDIEFRAASKKLYLLYNSKGCTSADTNHSGKAAGFLQAASCSYWTPGCSSLVQYQRKDAVRSQWRDSLEHEALAHLIKLLEMEKTRSQRIGLVQQKDSFPWETASAVSLLLSSRLKHKHEVKEAQKVISGADRAPLCPATSLLNLLLCTDHLSWEPSQISGFTTGLKNKAKAATVPGDPNYQKAGGRICSQWKGLQKPPLLKIQITPRKCPWPSDDFRGWACQLNISAKLLLVCRTEILAWTVSA